MPSYEEATASIAASTTDNNVISGKVYESSPGPRVLQALAAAVLDNAPANGDLTGTIYVGSVEAHTFRPGLVRTTGTELQADDYKPVSIPIPPNTRVRIKIQNNDAAAAHSALLGLVFDRF